jgi:ABC-2 type transport system ATP-binding protein
VGNNRDWKITSFDGTVIQAHWFPNAAASAAKPAPTLLMGPGWGSAGDVNVAAAGLLGAISIRTLLDHGYNVLTWDPRGFGQSTGNAEVDSPDFEAHDVQRLLDWVATQPEVQLDRPGDPRSGMVGASYGGGVQFVTAAADCRVDAIVPIIAWHSLTSSLFKAGIPKLGWANLLLTAAAGAHLDPVIKHAAAAANSGGTFPADDVKFFADRGPSDTVSSIHVPTLIIQGTVDGLFTLDEAVSNYALLKAAGTPVSMLWYCGGHGVCLTNAGDPGLLGATATNWLDRYVKRDTSAAALNGFEFVDQHGAAFTTGAYPAAAGNPVTAAGSGTLSLVATGGSGPSTATPTDKGLVSSISLGITPAKAANAVNVAIPAPAAQVVVVGAPKLTISYSGTASAGDRPTVVFAQLVDTASGLVLGNQITPIPVVLDGQPHTAAVDLELIAHTMAPGTALTLQLVATTVVYSQPRLGGKINFSAIGISLPVITGVTAVK